MSCFLLNKLGYKVQKMRATKYINAKLSKIPQGLIFTAEKFTNFEVKKASVVKALNRMASSGKILKFAKGKFYKPEKTIFGNLTPSQEEVIKDLLIRNGKPVGYITGVTIFNSLGLTTQLSNKIEIAQNDARPDLIRDRFKVSFIKQKNLIKKSDIRLLQILDAIRYIKKIPDTNIKTACVRLKDIFKKFTDSESKRVINLSLNYPPATRALVGAIFEEIGKKELTEPIAKSLNSLTSYNLIGADMVLNCARNWNIK